MENKNVSLALEKIKGFFRKDLAFKIISLMFAMLVWGYVMMEQNPVREKTLTGINASFAGEADLISRNLIIRGRRSELLSNISANVNVNLTNFADVDANDVTATVSLRNVTGAGTYSLPIDAVCTNATVESKTPGYVEVEIDDLVTKRIPVEYKIVTNLPEGYWAAEPVLSRTEVDIQGAAQDIEQIVKGICFIDLSSRTESYNEAMEITLMDANGNAKDRAVLYGQLAAVSVKQTVMHKKTLRVNAVSSLMGADNLAANYEIAAVNVTPTTVDVAGKQDVLDMLSEISVENIDVAGRSESLLETAELIVPEGVTLTKEDDLVSVYIDIRERTEDITFEDMNIKVEGAQKRANVTVVPEIVNITVSGGVSVMKHLNRSDVTLYVDVTDLAPGEYDLRIQTKLANQSMMDQVSCTLGAETAKVKIS